MSEWLVKKGASLLQARTSRRSFLMRAAMAGTAVTVSPVRYLFKPGTAYAAICGCGGYNCDCGSACCDGYSAFCCEVGGANACPSGTFPGGWWRADGSVFCGGTRYIVDCNASCGSGWGCSCAQEDCGRRVSGCNWFRYGQCNDHISCAGPIVCRMATCEPPYNLDLGCSSDTFSDDWTANHSADCSTTGTFAEPESTFEEAPVEEFDSGLSERELEREERSRQREAERSERSAQREAERAERSRQRDEERGGD